MKKAAIFIDSWKLEIFTKHLKKGGCAYEVIPCLTPNTLSIKVHFESVAKLKPIVEAANEECAKFRKEKLQ